MLNRKFGYLQVLQRAERPAGTRQRCVFWLCRCSCGTKLTCRGTALRSGHTTSCGCDGIDRTPRRNRDGSYSIAMSGGYDVIVDAADLPLVTQYRWRAYAVKSGLQKSSIIYARTGVGKDRVTMHRLLTGFKMTDHKDSNGLNNRRSNLRNATAKQNCGNSRKRRVATSSKFKGVAFHKTTGRWVAQAAGKYIGLFENEIDAAKAYNRAAKKRWGKFAKLNPVRSGQDRASERFPS